MAKKNVHVTHREEGWAVKSENTKRAEGIYDTQADAIERAREIAKNNRSELVIHDRNNLIRDKDSYGNDPYPPKDKKY